MVSVQPVSNNVVAKNKAQKRSKIGVVAGLAVSGTIKSKAKIPVRKCMQQMQKIGSNLTSDEFHILSEAAKKIPSASKLAGKGVEIITVNERNTEEVAKTLAESIVKKHKFLKNAPALLDFLTRPYVDMFKNNKNAFFDFASNKIFVGSGKELSASVFHEAGHAMNKNLSKMTNLLQKGRCLSKWAAPLALIAVLHSDKTDKNGKQSMLNKAGGFIKKHIVGLTLLSFLPTLAEEGLASIRGGKLAKQLLDPALVNKVNKTNLLGFATYALLAGFTAAGAKLGVKAADKITEKVNAKKAKKAQKANS